MSLLLKPKIFQDIKKRGDSVFREPSCRINLSYKKVVRIPLTLTAKLCIVSVAVASVAFMTAAAPTTAAPLIAKTSDEERAALEGQLKDLEAQINQYETQIASYQKQGKTLSGEISRLNDKISAANLRAKTLKLQIVQIERKIGEATTQIAETQQEIDRNREALRKILRNLSQTDDANLFEIFLKNPRLSDFYGDINNATLLQANLRATINKVTDLQKSLKEKKEELAMSKAEAQDAQAYQLYQKREADVAKQEKAKLLEVTKGQQSKYAELKKATVAAAAKIRGRIFELLGGGQLTFQQAYNYAKVASDATGVRPALILAVLDRESALGKNVGKCKYQTAMNPKDQDYFIPLLKELGMDPNSVNVSCANADGAYGGAMGPAQFIPSTWNLYKARISKITGKNPPSPWNSLDAFVATGLYLADAGAANASVSVERQAAARYYAGGNWRRFLWTYGEAVISRAQKFQQDIETMMSG